MVVVVLMVGMVVLLVVVVMIAVVVMKNLQNLYYQRGMNQTGLFPESEKPIRVGMGSSGQPILLPHSS